LLADMGFLKKADHITEVECSGTAMACLKTVTPHEGKLYINCDCEEGVGLIEITKAHVDRSEVDLKFILDWMAQELNLSGGVTPVQNGESWFLGKRKGNESSAHFYFLRSDSHDQVTKFNDHVHKENPIILWLGQPPHTGIFPKNIISLGDALDARREVLFLNRKLLSKVPRNAQHALGGKAIILDQNIAMQIVGDVPYLLFEREGNVFLRQKRIRPQAFEIIRFLHAMQRKKENAFKLGDFVERGFVGEKRTASSRIREINDFCAEMDTKPIFHKFPGDKWGLNPNLDE